MAVDGSRTVPPFFAPLRNADWILDLNEPVASLSVSPDGTRAAVLSTEGTLFWVELATGRRLNSGQAHEGGGFRVQWNPRHDRVASCGQDGKVRVWNGADGSEIAAFAVGAAWVEQVAWSPDGTILAAAAGKGVVLWRPEGGVFHQFRDHRSTVAALDWWGDGSRLAAACYGGVAVYDPVSGDRLQQLPWKTSLLSLAVSPDRKWVVAGTQENSVQIWPLPFVEGEELAMSGYAAKVRDLAWHHSGRYLATGGGEDIMVWDCGGKGPAGTTPRILEGHLGRISALAYQRQGHVLASGGQDGNVFFWNAGKSSQALRQVKLSGPLTALAWTPDDRKVVAGTQDGRLALAASPA